MESSFSISNISLNPLQNPFIFQNTPENLLHEQLGYLKLPLIGSYSRSGYEMDRLLSVFHFQGSFDKKNILQFDYENKINDIQLPKEVITVLTDIPKKYRCNKHTKNQPLNNDFEFLFKKEANFVWTITFNENRNTSIKNLINHVSVFETIDFSKQKKHIENLPIGIITPSKYQKNNGIFPYDIDSTALAFNELRSEYLSIHLKSNDLCFSPNNMKFSIDNNGALNHFWSVGLRKIGPNIIVYHWVINDYLKEVEESFRKSHNLSDFIEKMKIIIGPDHGVFPELSDVFNI